MGVRSEESGDEEDGMKEEVRRGGWGGEEVRRMGVGRGGEGDGEVRR